MIFATSIFGSVSRLYDNGVSILCFVCIILFVYQSIIVLRVKECSYKGKHL